jgi:hypothetical protein
MRALLGRGFDTGSRGSRPSARDDLIGNRRQLGGAGHERDRPRPLDHGLPAGPLTSMVQS